MTERSVYMGPWRIDLTVREGVVVPLPGRRLARAAAEALVAAGAPSPASLGLIFSDDAELADLNGRHMGVAGPTDVLSFPLLPTTAFPGGAGVPARAPGGAARPGARAAAAYAVPSGGQPDLPAFATPPGRRLHLGDVVVSVERAAEQAEEGRGGQTGDVRWSAADELLLLVTHGTLHVCGWDHASPDEETAMRALERRLLG